MKYRVKQVPLAQLKVDLRVQRDIKEHNLRKLTANFEPALIGVIIVSEREDGSLWVADGQTRVAAARANGMTGTITAIVYTGLSLQEEARLFLGHNAKSSVRALDKLRVSWSADELHALDIERALNAAGFSFRRGSRLRPAFAAGALIKAHRLTGGANLERTMRVLNDAWPTDENAAHGVLILSVAQFLDLHKAVDPERLARILSAERPMTFVADTKQVKTIERLTTLDEAGVRILTNAYNRQLRTNRIEHATPAKRA